MQNNYHKQLEPVERLQGLQVFILLFSWGEFLLFQGGQLIFSFFFLQFENFNLKYFIVRKICKEREKKNPNRMHSYEEFKKKKKCFGKEKEKKKQQ